MLEHLEKELESLKSLYEDIENEIEDLLGDIVINPFTLSDLKKERDVLQSRIDDLSDKAIDDLIA